MSQISISVTNGYKKLWTSIIDDLRKVPLRSSCSRVLHFICPAPSTTSTSYANLSISINLLFVSFNVLWLKKATITTTRVLAFTDTCSWQRSLKYRDSTTRRDQWVYLKLFENYTVTPPANQHPPSFNCRISRPLLPFHSFFSRPKLNPIWRKWPSLSAILFISNAMSVNGQHTCVLGSPTKNFPPLWQSVKCTSQSLRGQLLASKAWPNLMADDRVVRLAMTLAVATNASRRRDGMTLAPQVSFI